MMQTFVYIATNSSEIQNLKGLGHAIWGNFSTDQIDIEST